MLTLSSPGLAQPLLSSRSADTYPSCAASKFFDFPDDVNAASDLSAKPPEDLVGREVVRLQHGVYGTTRTLRRRANEVEVILFRSEGERPAWVTENFPNARTVLRVDDVSSMAAATRNHLGLSRMPCFMGPARMPRARFTFGMLPTERHKELWRPTRDLSLGWPIRRTAS